MCLTKTGNGKCVFCKSRDVDHSTKDRSFQIVCEDCNVLFYDPECYEAHLIAKVCEKASRCLDCGVRIQAKKNDSGEMGFGHHACGDFKCKGCGKTVIV